MVIPSGRPVSTYSHEMGHIFWARDEYPGAGSWTDQRGYYDAQNLNASDNPTEGFEQQISIMRGGSIAAQAYSELVSPPSTLAMIGWRDSDGDGIFDLMDVPLQMNAVGYWDADASAFHIAGEASVDTLPNANSSGLQSDITLAKVSELQYQLDDGDWQTVLAPDAVSVDFDLSIPIQDPFDSISWRVIDTNTGITSGELVSTSTKHVFSGGGACFSSTMMAAVFGKPENP